MTPLEALELAYQVIMQASCKEPHHPWCNGIHEGCACEGVYQFNNAVEEIEKVLKANGRQTVR